MVAQVCHYANYLMICKNSTDIQLLTLKRPKNPKVSPSLNKNLKVYLKSQEFARVVLRPGFGTKKGAKKG
jgi:hypothetical protein